MYIPCVYNENRTMKLLSIIMLMSFTIQQATALSPEAEQGKKLFASCDACHNPDLSPPLAPPMFAVQKKYSKRTSNKQEFVQKVLDFVAKPSKQASEFPGAIEKLGLMPALGFPKQDVEKIAVYIYENKFSYPCGHWKAGMEMAKKSGDMKHYNKDKMKIKRFCSETKPIKTQLSVKPLKDVMSQLGVDFNELSLAIFAEDFEKISSSAHAIAFHPQVLPQQKKTLKGFFGKEMKLFKQADMKVHRLSSMIEQNAQQNDILAVIKNQGKLLQACMDCHQTFRKRAINALDSE